MILPVLGVALVLAAGFSLYAGAMRIPLAEVWRALIGDAAVPTHAAVVLKVRLPRLLLAVLVGSCLGVSGATF